MISIEDFHRVSPFRKPAWRWLLAESLRCEEQEPGALGDPAVAIALRYQRALDRAETDAERQAVDADAPDLAGAHAIYVERGPVRDEVEARLLAGESIAAISNKTTIPFDIVRSYATIFYDVQPYLGATDWLLDEAIGMYVGMDPGPNEAQTWKYWALAGGPLIVDILVADFHGRELPHIPDRHLHAQKARLLAWESVTGYSLADTVKVIERIYPLFLGPAGGRDTSSKLQLAKALKTLLMIVNVWAAAVAGREGEERKRNQRSYSNETSNRGQRNARKETAHGRAKQESEDESIDGWYDYHRRTNDTEA